MKRTSELRPSLDREPIENCTTTSHSPPQGEYKNLGSIYYKWGKQRLYNSEEIQKIFPVYGCLWTCVILNVTQCLYLTVETSKAHWRPEVKVTTPQSCLHWRPGTQVTTPQRHQQALNWFSVTYQFQLSLLLFHYRCAGYLGNRTYQQLCQEMKKLCLSLENWQWKYNEYTVEFYSVVKKDEVEVNVRVPS